MDKVHENNHSIPLETRSLISKRYKRMTKAVNGEFWDSSSETAHSRYVGSYGRGTAIDTSDLDILMELPREEYERYDGYKGNGQSRLLQALKGAIQSTWSGSNIRADGQVVVVNFSDGMRFEVLPAFEQIVSWDDDPHYVYPDTNMGGNWLTTNPIAEQREIRAKNDRTRGLLFDTCKHVRYVHTQHYSSYHLSGILIDSFVYEAIDEWRWALDGERGSEPGAFEKHLLERYNSMTARGLVPPSLRAPGSGQQVDARYDYGALGKVIRYIAE
ncbi:nucleotidyltransferase [Olsenella umbonata]|uniref:Nucleotidyltransferase n=1 Tax=Parafannyhessea umbonata TaxID=604330 RepID=A0A7X9T8M4_9ACTN|nr:nucleotidyltransferase domain-containing protein [Parafannyhessea umbonata]NMF24888.1 nucleotidyltransferase [Parafannyhessea umbonata]